MKAEPSQTTSNNTITSNSSATTIMQPNSNSNSRLNIPPSSHLKSHNLSLNIRPISSYNDHPVPPSAPPATSPDPPDRNLFPVSASAPHTHHHPPLGYLMQRNPLHHLQHTSSSTTNPHSSIPNYSRLPQHDSPLPTVTPLDPSTHYRSAPLSYAQPRLSPPPPPISQFRRSASYIPGPPPMLPSGNVGPGAMLHRLGNSAPRHPSLRHLQPTVGNEAHPPGSGDGPGMNMQQWFGDVDNHHNGNSQAQHPSQHGGGGGLMHSGGNVDNGEGNTNTAMDAAMMIGYGDAETMKRHSSNRSRMARSRPRTHSLTEKEKRERHNAHTKSSRLRIDRGLGRLAVQLKRMFPDSKLTKKADIVDAAERLIADVLDSGWVPRAKVASVEEGMNNNMQQVGTPINGLHHHHHHTHNSHHPLPVAVQHHEHDSSLSP